MTAQVMLVATGAPQATGFRCGAREDGGWRFETRFEVMVQEACLVPLAYAKLLVLWRDDQARLVVVDHLCRNRAGPRGVGRVCAAMLEGAAARYPAASVILCTVKTRVPTPFTQSDADQAAAVEFYKGLGLGEMPRGGGVFRCLRPLVCAVALGAGG